MSMNGLQKARGDCEHRLLSRFRSFQERTSTEAGRSIVWRMNIHSGDNLVIEQELSSCFMERGDQWTGRRIAERCRGEPADVFIQCLFGQTLAKISTLLLYLRLILINSKAQSTASNSVRYFSRRTFPKSLTSSALRLAPKIHG